MKRLLTLTLALALMVSFVQISVAGEGCTAAKQADNTKASMTTAKDMSHCTAENAEACAAKMGMTPEECKQLCASGNYTMVSMSIEGMTCTGCENSIRTALKELPGVIHVGKVSHEEGRAYVLVDHEKATDQNLVTTVSSKGYKAQIIPAVATTTPAGQTDAKGMACPSGATKSCAKTCTTPCGAAKTDNTKAKTEKGDGTL